jgi:2,3-dihydroxy-p-cumate/2,3-dihydroxybenzoate 3,4-dioxygenase
VHGGAGREFEEIPAAGRAAMHTGPGLRTWEPVTGCTIDFYVRAQEAGLSPYVPSVVSIERLGHLVLRSADAPSTLKYFTEVLNFQESDAIVEAVTFLRCFPNPLHHSLGVGTGKGRSGLHHLSFMVSDMDAIGSSVWRFQKLGVPIVNGPGRHLPSGSVFLYFLDPDGLTVEYSFGMEEFPEVDARAPRRLPRVPLSFDLWDGPVDPRKAQVGVIEQSKSRVQAANQA